MNKRMRQAIKQGNIREVIDMLDENKELLECETPFGTWLQVAAAHGKMDIVKLLLDRGIDVNKAVGIVGGGPIKDAAFKGEFEIVKFLHRNGAIFDTSDASKNPLLAAIYNGHIEIAKYLIDNGIDLTSTYNIGQLDAVDAYEYARQYGQTQIAEYIKAKQTELDN